MSEFRDQVEQLLKDEAETNMAVVFWKDPKGKMNFYVKAIGDIELLGAVTWMYEVISASIVHKALQPPPSPIVTAKRQPSFRQN